MKILPKPPPPEMALPISVETHQRLLTASARTKFDKEIWEIGAIAIHDWLARNEPEALTMPIADGYQWKKVFLPNGTLLRTVFDGQNFHCIVEGGRIRYKGVTMSPSGFANVVGGVRRNAWKVIWILFPNSAIWHLAESLRAKKPVVRAKRAR
jgi:hypothetical protein